MVIMMPVPTLTVIVPTRNVSPWIDDCLFSIRSQEGVDLRIVVVDDHSTDDTVSIVERHAADDARVTFVPAPTSGGGSARNLGVSLVETEYLAFADGDDLVPPGAYAALAGSLARTGSDMAVGDFYKFSSHRSWKPTSRWNAFTTHRAGIRLGDLPALIRNRSCWNRVMRAEFWRAERISFPDVVRSNDIVPMTAALSAARALDVVPDIVYLYRESPGGGSMTARAAASASLRSYLGQELLCAGLLATATPPVREEYARMVLEADGWVHLRRALLDARPWAPDDAAAIAETLGLLLAAVGEAAVHRVSAARRLPFRLVARGHIAEARRLLELTEHGWDPSRVADAVDTLIAAARGAGESAESRRKVVAELVLDPILRVARAAEAADLDHAIAAAAGLLDEETTAWIDAEAGRQRRTVAARLRAGDSAGLQRLSGLASERVEVDRVTQVGGRLIVSGSSTLPAGSPQPALFARRMHRAGTAQLEHAAWETAGHRVTWSVAIAPPRIGAGEWQLVARLEDEELGMIEIPVTAESEIALTPASRWAPVVALPRRPGERLVLLHRGRLVRRVVRKLVRVVRG